MLSKEIWKPARKPEAMSLEGSPSEGPCVEAPATRRNYSCKAATAAASLGFLALSGALFYRVRELLAALILFSVLFGVVIIAVLILWLVEEAAHKAAVGLEAHLSHVPARRVVAPVRVHSGHIHRSRPWN